MDNRFAKTYLTIVIRRNNGFSKIYYKISFIDPENTFITKIQIKSKILTSSHYHRHIVNFKTYWVGVNTQFAI